MKDTRTPRQKYHNVTRTVQPPAVEPASSDERYFERRLRMDDVYVPETPPAPAPVRQVSRRTGAGRGSVARNFVAAGMVATFMLSSIGITYGRLPGTGAFFADTETSTFNQFVANLLDFSASITGGDSNLKVVAEGGGSDSVAVSITPNPDSVETHYRVTVEPDITSDIAFCNALLAEVATPFVHNDNLILIDEIVGGNPSFMLTLSYLGTLTEEVCEFDIVFRGWDSRVPENTGYTDEERISITVTDPLIEGESLGVVLGATSDSTPSGSTDSPQAGSGQASSPQTEAAPPELPPEEEPSESNTVFVGIAEQVETEAPAEESQSEEGVTAVETSMVQTETPAEGPADVEIK